MIFNLLLQMRTDKYGWASIQYTNKKQAILYTQNRGENGMLSILLIQLYYLGIQ